MKVKLFRDLYLNTPKGVVKYPAGTTPDLPKDVADFVLRSTLVQRRRTRENALKFQTSVESLRAKRERG